MLIGAKLSRKSTSRGAMVVGSHRISVWSTTQSVIANTSAVSEFCVVVKGACEGLGVTTLLKELGVAGV